MAVHILPHGYHQRSFGEVLGTGLGQGLARLAQNKINEIESQKESQLFQNAGYTPEAAKLLVHLKRNNPNNFHHILGMVGNQGQQTGEGQGQPGSAQPLFSNKGSSQNEALQLKRDIANEKKIEPFLVGLSQDYNSAKVLYSKAKGMLENLQKNKKKWPNQLIGTIAPEQSYTDKDIRKYLADSTSLVTALANSRKGQPTNFKLKFEQLSKPNLSQPYETQVELLKGIIKDAENVFKTQKYVSHIKDQNQGKYPSDLREKLIQHGITDLTLEEPENINQNSFSVGSILSDLPNPSQLPAGTEIQSKDGTILVNNGNQWIKKGK